MPVNYRTSATDDTTAGEVSLQVAVARPAAVLDGDFLLASVASASSGVTITPPDGWTLLRRDDLGSTSALATYYRFALREPTRWVWSFSVEARHTVAVRAYTGVDVFYPVEAQTGSLLASAAPQFPPAVYTTEQNTLLSIALVATGSVTLTPDTSIGYRERTEKNVTAITLGTADRILETAGTSQESQGWALSGAATAICHNIALRPSVGTVSADEVRSLLKSLFPPGAENLYDWDNVDANVYKLIAAEADWLKYYGFDYVDLLRKEFNPARAAVFLSTWEGALGISANVATAVNTWLSTRRNAVVSKLREGGACTETNIRAVLEPLLGYYSADLGTLQVVECNREQLRQLHSYEPIPSSPTTPPIAISAPDTKQFLFDVYDDGEISKGGVQVEILLTCADPSTLSVSVSGPSQTTWSGGPTQATGSVTLSTLPRGAVTRQWVVVSEASTTVGKFIRGTWSLYVATTSEAATVFGIRLFVEGAGQDSTGFVRPDERYGRGMAAHSWGVWADPMKYDATLGDFAAVRKAIERIRPGHSYGNIIRSSATVALGSLCAIPDDALCFPDQCIPTGDMTVGWTGAGGDGADGGALIGVIYARPRALPVSDLTAFSYVHS